jgi:hypothetical protein
LAKRRDSSALRDGLALLATVSGANPGTAALPNLWFAMRRWIDELSFRTRVVLTVLVVAIMIAVMAWDMIEISF